MIARSLVRLPVESDRLLVGWVAAGEQVDHQEG